MTDSTMKKLQDKVAIVTGGASGIGEATARQFALHGARAVVIADVQDEKGQNVAASIGPDRSTFIHCDVTDEDQVKALIESTVQMYGRLDVMFSNAGIAKGGEGEQTVLDLDLSTYDKLMALNARGMAACVKHAAKAMVEGGVRGSIICTASVAASIGVPKMVDYVMSKHAVLGLVRSASVQLGAYGIHINCVSPGAVATPQLSSVFKVNDVEDLGKFAGSNLEGKMIYPQNVADAVVFLASEDSKFVTGHNLQVDGGGPRVVEKTS